MLRYKIFDYFQSCIHRTENHISSQSLTKIFSLLGSLCELSSYWKVFGFFCEKVSLGEKSCLLVEGHNNIAVQHK